MPIVVNWEKLAKVVLAFLLFTFVFVGLEAYFATVDVAAFPEVFQPILSRFKYFFTLPLTLFFVATLRNYWGYIVEWVRGKYVESYEFNKYLGTVGYYVGIVGTFLTAASALNVPEPYRSFAVFLLIIVDLLKQAFQTLNFKAILGD